LTCTAEAVDTVLAREDKDDEKTVYAFNTLHYVIGILPATGRSR